MALILNIETSSPVCSVALAENGFVLASKVGVNQQDHAVSLSVLIQELLSECKTDIHSLDAIAVSIGPGSYTGLRIGVSVAKGICYGADKPIIAISTLQTMALQVSKNYKELTSETWLCPMIDARRMEVYCGMFDMQNQSKQDITPLVVTENSFREILSERKIAFFGDGAEKCKNIIVSPNAIFIDGITSRAEHMIGLSEKKFQEKQFESVAYLEPFYLKDFVATVPKNKVL